MIGFAGFRGRGKSRRDFCVALASPRLTDRGEVFMLATKDWGRGDAGTRGHGDTGTRRRGDTETGETRGRGDAGTRGRGDGVRRGKNYLT